MVRPLFHWLFYGHLWIALAALALAWQSTYLAYGDRSLRWEHAFVLLATLGVYSAHRLLSYSRARGKPAARRYGIVRRYPLVSAAIASCSLLAAVWLVYWAGLVRLWPVVIALPFTLFYLIPLYPGGPRLRDLPYLKVIWVALSWAVMTDVFPVPPAGGARFEIVIRFAFTLAVALLFDLRDVDLDRRQGVRTLAAACPNLSRMLACGLIIGCAACSLLAYPGEQSIPLAVAYLLAAGIGWQTVPGRDEDWYAVAVNGMLLLPPLALLLRG